MSWINDKATIYRLRDNDYNRSVCMTAEALENMMVLYDTIFDPIANQTDEIATLQVFPLNIRVYNSESGRNYLKTSSGIHTNVTAYKISWYAYYQTLGEFYVEPKFNNFADYKGYTQIRVFLPYLGFVDVDPNECMGKWLQFRLYIDFYTGKGMHIIGVSDSSIQHATIGKIEDGEDDGMRVLSTYECDLGVEIPLGKSNIGDIKRNMLLGAVKVASGAIGAFTPSPPTITHSSTDYSPTTTTYNIQGRGSFKGARMVPMKTGSETTQRGSSSRTTIRHYPVNKTKATSDTVNASLDVLSNLSLHGSTDRVNDASCLYCTSHQVQVVIYRPKFVTLDENYGALYGYPLGSTQELGDLRGYTEINAIHIEGEGFETITNKEVALLEEVFANGIIL